MRPARPFLILKLSHGRIAYLAFLLDNALMKQSSKSPCPRYQEQPEPSAALRQQETGDTTIGASCRTQHRMPLAAPPTSWTGQSLQLRHALRSPLGSASSMQE